MIATARQMDECEAEATFDWQMYSAAKAALSASKYSALRKLNCRVFDGIVEISGTVPSFYLKQLAQAAILQLHGGSVRNLVEVSDESDILVATTCGTAKVRRSA